MDFVADTTLLIGLWRGQPWARAFAREHSTKRLGLPWIVLGEFWHGALRAGHDPTQVHEFLAIGIPILETETVIPHYAKICSKLQQTSSYASIGQNDLWIAAVSLALDRPLVSRNIRHFEKIEGLKILIAIER